MANSMQASEARKSAKTGPVAEPLAQPARLGYVGGRGHARLSEVAGPTERGRSRKLSSKRVFTNLHNASATVARRPRRNPVGARSVSPPVRGRKRNSPEEGHLRKGPRKNNFLEVLIVSL